MPVCKYYKPIGRVTYGATLVLSDFTLFLNALVHSVVTLLKQETMLQEAPESAVTSPATAAVCTASPPKRSCSSGRATVPARPPLEQAAAKDSIEWGL